LLQVLSNLVNELGDWKRGTDKEQQSRKPLSLQNNRLSEKQFGVLLWRQPCWLWVRGFCCCVLL